MNQDQNAIQSNQVIYTTFPRSRLNTWISNLNTIAATMEIGNRVSTETRSLIYANKIQEVVNIIAALCTASETKEKLVKINQTIRSWVDSDNVKHEDIEEEPIYETYPISFTISGRATKNEVIYASFFDSIRQNYNSLINWYEWYTAPIDI